MNKEPKGNNTAMFNRPNTLVTGTLVNCKPVSKNHEVRTGPSTVIRAKASHSFA